MIIKTIAASAIILSCSYIGLKLSNSLKRRVVILSEMLSAISKIENYVTTIRMPLDEIYAALSHSKGVVGEFFSKVHPGISWKQHIDLLTGLTPQDKSVIVDLSEQLGSLDVERQVHELELSQALLSSLLTKAKSEMDENSKVYKSMSFFTGVVIAILLI